MVHNLMQTLSAHMKNIMDAIAVSIGAISWTAAVAAATSTLTLVSLLMSVCWLGIRIYDRVKYGRGMPSSKD